MPLSLSTMAQSLCNLQPPLISSFHLKQHQKVLQFTSVARTKHRLSLPFHSSNARRFRFSSLRSASVNGYASEEYKRHEAEEAEVELFERLRRLFVFLRSILPGGDWWNFSDDAEIRIFAKPVTVTRALTRMWGLVARDRCVIFAAFSALIVAAVRAFINLEVYS